MFENVETKNQQSGVSPVTPPISSAPTNNQSQATAGTAEEIHTMPMEYYLGDKTLSAGKGGSVAGSASAGNTPGGKKKWLNIIIIVVLVLVVGVSAYLLIKSFEKPAATTKEATVADKKVTDKPAKVTEPAKEEKKEEVKEEKKEEPKKEEVKKTQFNPADIKKFTLSLMGSIDTDKDGLTDKEEELIGTDKSKIDSDVDTYQDGDELKNFYSPLDKGNVRVAEKSFIKEYNNAYYGYKLLYPAKWLVAALDDKNPKEVMLTISEGEFIDLLIDEKKATQTLESWYLEKAPTVKPTDIKKYQTTKKVSVIESPDGFTTYFNKNNAVYIINYNIGLKEEADYPALYRLMVNSFEFIPITEIVAQVEKKINYDSLVNGMGFEYDFDKDKVTVTASCGNEKCFYDYFLECGASTATFNLSESLVYEMQIMNSKDNGCVVKSKFSKHPNADWQGKEMSCIYNNTKSFEEAVKGYSKCEGDLYKLISTPKT